MLFIDCFKILMSNVTLNVAGDVSFNCLNLTSFPSSGNFSFVTNSNYSVSNKNEYGTIIIGPIQIKFGYSANDGSSSEGSNSITFTTPFPTNIICAIGNIYGSGTCNVIPQSRSEVIFYNGGAGNYVYWIAIGN